MTKTILTIAGALALTFPLTLLKSNQSQPLVETNNTIVPAVERLTPNTASQPGACTRFSYNLPVHEAAVETVSDDVFVPVHCKEPNCGLGVYSKHEGSSQETCSSCGSFRPAGL